MPYKRLFTDIHVRNIVKWYLKTTI